MLSSAAPPDAGRGLAEEPDPRAAPCPASRAGRQGPCRGDRSTTPSAASTSRPALPPACRRASRSSPRPACHAGSARGEVAGPASRAWNGQGSCADDFCNMGQSIRLGSVSRAGRTAAGHRTMRAEGAGLPRPFRAVSHCRRARPGHGPPRPAAFADASREGARAHSPQGQPADSGARVSRPLRRGWRDVCAGTRIQLSDEGELRAPCDPAGRKRRPGSAVPPAASTCRAFLRGRRRLMPQAREAARAEKRGRCGSRGFLAIAGHRPAPSDRCRAPAWLVPAWHAQPGKRFLGQEPYP